MAMIEVTGVAMPQTAAEVRALARQAISRRKAAYYIPPPPAPEPVIKAPAEPPYKRIVWLQPPSEVENEPSLPPPSIRAVQNAAVRYFQITLAELLARGRRREITTPRQVFMYVAVKATGKSLPEIGRRTGGRDHTTILHGFRQVAKFCNGGNRPCALFDVAGVMDVLRSQGHPV